MAKRFQLEIGSGERHIRRYLDDHNDTYIVEFYNDQLLQIDLTMRTADLLEAIAAENAYLTKASTSHTIYEGPIYISVDEQCVFRLIDNKLQVTPIFSQSRIDLSDWEDVESDIWDAKRAELLTKVKRTLTAAMAYLYNLESNGG